MAYDSIKLGNCPVCFRIEFERHCLECVFIERELIGLQFDFADIIFETVSNRIPQEQLRERRKKIHDKWIQLAKDLESNLKIMTRLASQQNEPSSTP